MFSTFNLKRKKSGKIFPAAGVRLITVPGNRKAAVVRSSLPELILFHFSGILDHDDTDRIIVSDFPGDPEKMEITAKKNSE